MIEINKLRDYASKLMFDMDDKEYQTLQGEFEIILKQMDLIAKIDGIANVCPMTFPYINEDVTLREDEAQNFLDVEDVLLNVKKYEDDQIRVPKVVE